MRIEFIETDAKWYAWERAPWAAKMLHVCGGFLAFESVKAYLVWKDKR